MMLEKESWLSGIMGLVVGDACGVPVEFKAREELKVKPVTDMREYGSHDQPRGTWSDDSSMALANLKSLHNGYDLGDIMEQFSRWDRDEVYTPFGEVFDMGYTCSQAIRKFQDNGDPKACGMCGERDNGNGSLMRILPMCLYAYEKTKSGLSSEDEAIEMIHDVSALTHAHLRSKMACGLYYFLVKSILEHKESDSIGVCLQKGFDEGFAYYRKNTLNLVEVARYSRLADMKKFSGTDEVNIKSSGYVLEAFEAAVWSLLQADNYKDSVLIAVNLGNDTDTVAAIAGGLAGLYYGYDNMPADWLDCIIQKEWIEELCDFSFNKGNEYLGPIVDTHSHFMPYIDDGSISMEMSVDMLQIAKEEGVTDLFVTSHGDYVCEQVDKYHKTFEQLKKEAEKAGVRLFMGCEVFCEISSWDFEVDNDDIKLVINALDEGIYPVYNDTDYVLTEFDIGVQPADALYIVKRIQSAGYIPVLAHVERYPFLIRENFVEKLVEEGCLVQINAYSLQEEKTKIFKQNARYLLGKGLVNFIGSDAHRSDYRPPRMRKGVQYIWEFCDKEYAQDVIYRNAYKNLLRGDE